MIRAAEEDYARPVTRLALRLLALTAVRPSELRGAQWMSSRI
jgi:integrase